MNHIAKWDGSIWSGLGNGLDETANNLAVDSRGNLYTDILVITADGMPETVIRRWDGSSWSTLGGDLSRLVDTLAEGRDSNIIINDLVVGSQDQLYAGGYFYLIQTEQYVGYVAQWDGSTWTLLGSGMNHTVYDLAVDGQDNLYAGGEFTVAGDTPANRIAKWDGSTWSALGSGLGGDAPTINDLAVDESGNLYVAGQFSTAGVPAQFIARWDGASWSALLSATGNGVNDRVFAVAVDGDGRVFVGGFFTSAGGQPANRIARWEGSTWFTWSEGSGGGMNSAVDALAYDSSGVLYAGGYFTSTGAVPANRIALWDGADWRALGTGTDNGVNGSVHALGVDGRGGLYAGGEFTMAGDIPVNYVARWDGSAWNALGSGMAAEHASPQVRALVVDSQGDLYAGGDFTSAGSVAVNYIARWDGESWSALGSGIGAEGDYSYLSTLVVDAKGNLFAGGQFTLAGKKPSAYLAKWCAELDAGICTFAVAAGETTQAPTPVVIAQTTATAESLTVSPTASGPTPFPTQTAVPAAAVQDDGGDNSRFVIGAAAALAFLLSGFLWFRFRRQKGGGRS